MNPLHPTIGRDPAGGHETLRVWAGVLGTALIYFAAAKFGLRFAFVAKQVTVVWPPTGIALAALLVLGPRAWPGITLGAFFANYYTEENFWTAGGIAVGNTLEAVGGAWLLRRLGFRQSLERLRDALVLIVGAAAVSTIVSATIGVTTLCLGDERLWANFWPVWRVWYIGDGMGDLVVAPLLLVWSRAPRRLLDRRRPAETAALLGSAALVTLVVFAGRLGIGLRDYPLHYTVFPFVIWAALRFGQLGTTAVTFVVAGVAIWSTANGLGPFAHGTVHESLVMLQLYMAVIAVTGLLLGAAIAERDAAEARQATDYAALQVSEERLRLALEAGRLGVWDWNVGSGQVQWSENLEPIHGLPRGGFPGTFEGFLALVHPDDRERVHEAIRRALEDGSGYDIEFRNLWPDGSVHAMAAKGRVLRDAEGRPVRMLGTATDVSERRRLEDDLRRHAEQLADADRRKDEFLAMLAHELRNPLAPLGTSLELLGSGAAGRERFLDMAKRQVKHLVRLVDDLLDVSRITRGKITLRREPVLLADVVARAVELARPLVDARGQALTVSLPPEPVRVEADAVRLTQVFANLLGNAAKYTPPRGSIWLTAECVGDEVAVRVRDTGVGLPPELLPHIFDLFVQGDASLDRTRGGLGIGLTLVRALVELHGGRVEARSAGLEKGSEFVAWLPALPGGLPALAAAPAAAPPAVASGRLKILLVEDHQDTAESVAAMLEGWGHGVQVAFDGLSALRAAAALAPDVVLSDLGLPGMDGYELARQLRQQPGFGRILLVALSGYGREEDKRRALEAGFDHHLVKPPDMDVLRDLLAAVAAGSAERGPRALH
ncbi:MAG TPA: MASE1 domain-containing protein [Verrucomicrobiae bacterium]|nr:MASE1 domain-containing protein [Verrucomicrobiae bacterium]